MSHFSLMARFNAWVNRRLYAAVSTIDDDSYRRGRGAFFGSVHATLNHLMVVDRMWTRRIEGVDHGLMGLDQILHEDFSSLRDARVGEDARLVALVDALPPERLGERVTYERMIGSGREEMRVDHILLTLFNHQTHHRGQIHVMLTQDGHEVPPLDVGFFLEDFGWSGDAGTSRDPVLDGT